MAKFTLINNKADNFCFLSNNTNTHASFFNNSCLKFKNSHLIPSKRILKFRVLCSVKEKENVKESERVNEVVSGLRVEGLKQTGLQLGNDSGLQEVGFDWNWPPWKNIPQRYKLIGTTSLAFVICNMDKVNLSVAIIPMSHQFGWNASMAGLVQSSFFWGYALSQLPGGWLSKIFGGRKVLKIGVLVWSLATAFVPLLAGFMPGLVLSRVLVGIGEGVSPSAATDLIARLIPLEERSRAVAFVFGGLSVGSVAGLLLAPPLIQIFGWESVFYIFGFLGIAWFLTFQFLEEEQSSFAIGPTASPQSTYLEKSWNTSLPELSSSLKDVPWKAFFETRAVWAMIYAHFCGSWGHYTCLSWLPSYFSEELNLNLTEAAWVSILPPLASVFVTSIAAQFADNLIANGVETTTVRKICQTVAFLSPAVCMTLSSVDLGLPPWEIVGILSGGLALSSFALSGLYCTHQDISPEYASILLGITNTAGAIPGIVGVALTGYLLDTTHSWSLSLFAPSIFFYLTGTVVWLALASSKPQNFSKRS
ncbi:probable anion transporter 6, chloroplastic [Ricinus communis]|uniref:Inner membrane transport protein yjjL, putative n=1 Tax=Ricinus communis TaxID=3988 RepID=B9T601_RICCO|nr:probable anion transporter 6, chloroplastic [Ricinus communis]EEF28716.1 Inner membrane transport protein yjjL, putative [Ricinus communis]|eukprot:XP_002533670.1 probable anion transporter 6, chloroplastic [Ricinus communis]